MCKLEACSTGPEVTLSLTICENLSWSVSYRNQRVNQEFCRLLRDMPSEINTGILLNSVRYLETLSPNCIVLKAREIITIIYEAAVCQGNSDERFLALPNIRKNSMKDSTSMSL